MPTAAASFMCKIEQMNDWLDIERSIYIIINYTPNLLLQKESKSPKKMPNHKSLTHEGSKRTGNSQT